MDKARRQALIASALIFGVHGCVTSKDGPAKAELDLRPASTTGLEAARSDGLYQDAVAAIDRRDYALALDMLQAARARAPQDARVLNAFGVVYDKLGRFDLSSRYYKLAMAADPGSRIIAQNEAYSAKLQGKAPANAAPTALAQATPSTPTPRTAAAEPAPAPRLPVRAPAPAAPTAVVQAAAAMTAPPAATRAAAPPATPAVRTAAAEPARATTPPVREPAPAKVATAAAAVFAPSGQAAPPPRPVVMPTPAKLADAILRPAAALISAAPQTTPKVAATSPVPAPTKPVAAPQPPAIAATNIGHGEVKPKDVRRAAAEPPATAPRPIPVKVSLPRPTAARPAPAKRASTRASAPAPRVQRIRTGSGALLGKPVAVVYSATQRGEGEHLRRQLARRGWSLSATALNTRIATRTTIRYEPAHERVAMALARSLAIPVKLEKCVRSCSGVTLTLGAAPPARTRRQVAGIGVRRLG